MGWALKERKKNKQFCESQVKFLLEIYKEGEKSAKKKDPTSVAQLTKPATTPKKIAYQRRKGNASVEDDVENSLHYDDDDDDIDSMEGTENELEEEEHQNESDEHESNCSDEENEDKEMSDIDEDLLCAIVEDRRDMEIQQDLETMSHTHSVINDSTEQCKENICQSN